MNTFWRLLWFECEKAHDLDTWSPDGSAVAEGHGILQWGLGLTGGSGSLERGLDASLPGPTFCSLVSWVWMSSDQPTSCFCCHGFPPSCCASPTVIGYRSSELWATVIPFSLRLFLSGYCITAIRRELVQRTNTGSIPDCQGFQSFQNITE